MKLVIATSNKGKLAEMLPILQEAGIEGIPQSHFGFPDAEETGCTFVENALLKARNACQQTGLPALAITMWPGGTGASSDSTTRRQSGSCRAMISSRPGWSSPVTFR